MISVITPTYNNIQELCITLESLRCVRDFVSEVIIINGGSKIQLDDFDDLPILMIQESDNGIYDAMNKGVSLSNGAYLLFLNSGDTVNYQNHDAITDVLSIVIRDMPDLVLFDSYQIDIHNEVQYKACRPRSHWLKRMPTHHQAILFKHSVLKDHAIEYDLGMKIASDYKFFLSFYSVSSVIRVYNVPLVKFIKGGASYQKRWLGLVEQFKIRRQFTNIPFAVFIFIVQMVGLVIRDYLPWFYSFLKSKL